MKKKFFIPLFFLIIVEYVACFVFFINSYPLRYKNLIIKYSDQFNLEPSLVAGLILQESKFNPRIISKKGAVGLMQIMPKTANFVCEMLGEDFDYNKLFLPDYNLKIGCKYLNYLNNKFFDEKSLLCAYNAGETNTFKWLKLQNNNLTDIPYHQTKIYVQNILKFEKYYKKRFINI